MSQASGRETCPAQYESVPLNRRGTTHTCSRLYLHEGPHLCPVCLQQWDKPAEQRRRKGQR